MHGSIFEVWKGVVLDRSTLEITSERQISVVDSRCNRPALSLVGDLFFRSFSRVPLSVVDDFI